MDIDETICWTIGYLVGEMQKLFGNPEKLSVTDLIAKYRYIKHVPYWQTEAVKAWTDIARASGGLKEKLPLIPGALEYTLKIHKIMPIVAYITARPEVVYGGTQAWLKKHGFPKAEIILRPAHISHEDGNKWKAGVLHELYPHIIGIVDDNAGLLEHLPANYQGKIFLYDNVSAPVAKSSVIACPTWSDVHKAMLEWPEFYSKLQRFYL